MFSGSVANSRGHARAPVPAHPCVSLEPSFFCDLHKGELGGTSAAREQVDRALLCSASLPPCSSPIADLTCFAQFSVSKHACSLLSPPRLLEDGT